MPLAFTQEDFLVFSGTGFILFPVVAEDKGLLNFVFVVWLLACLLIFLTSSVMVDSTIVKQIVSGLSFCINEEYSSVIIPWSRSCGRFLKQVCLSQKSISG